MITSHVFRTASDLLRRHRGASLAELCEAESICLLHVSMGQGQACKGFFLFRFGVPCIVVNQDLEPWLQRVVLAHELGHAMLHRELAGQEGFRDFALFDGADPLEKEANQFAAEILIPDKALLSLLESGMSIYEAASELDVPYELADFKIRSMRMRGYDLAVPLYTRGNFLKGIPIREEHYGN